MRTKKCHHCGAENLLKAKTCGNCGKNIGLGAQLKTIVLSIGGVILFIFLVKACEGLK